MSNKVQTITPSRKMVDKSTNEAFRILSKQLQLLEARVKKLEEG